METDQQLARRLAKGDKSALALLVHRWELPLGRYIRRHCFSCETEDLLQEVFLRVFRYIHDYDDNLAFSAWIYRITHNLMVSSLRKNASRQMDLSLDENLIPSHLFGADHPLQTREFHAQIAGILTQMPIKYREIFVLRFFEEMDYAQIGDVLCENGNTVATRLRRARELFMTLAQAQNLHLYLEEA